MNKPRYMKSFDYNKQAEPLPRARGVYSVLSPSPDPKKLIRYYYEDARTLPQAFARGARLNPHGHCLGTRNGTKYEWSTYSDVQKRARNFGHGLAALGVAPSKSSCVGIYAINSPLWFIAEQGCHQCAVIVVPLYDTFGAEACVSIIERARLQALVCDSEEKVLQLLDFAEGGVEERESKISKRRGAGTAEPPRPLGVLRNFIMMKDYSKKIIGRAEALGAKVISFEEVEDLGSKSTMKISPPKPSDVALICYTSGTSGVPKGVILTHENVIATVAGCLRHFEAIGERPFPSDVLISYLPMAHMLERVFQVPSEEYEKWSVWILEITQLFQEFRMNYILKVIMYVTGASIGFYSGNVRFLTEDVKHLRPTIFPAVPRVLNKIHDVVMARMSANWVTRTLVKRALKAKNKAIKERRVGYESIWEKIIFYPVRKGFGGRVRVVVVGSAPTSAEVLVFSRCAFGAPVLEGYGQTETSAPCTLTFADDEVPGHVGPPLPCSQIKIIDVPDMGYEVDRGDPGEICVRGTNVTSGYFEDAETTQISFTSDGWLRTGDIGVLKPDGCLVIVDRLSNMFKLPNGEYVAVEKLEDAYGRAPSVGQIFITGRPSKDFLVALIVPDEGRLRPMLARQNSTESLAKLCQVPETTKIIEEDMAACFDAYELKKFEAIKKFALVADPFTIENGLLTPTQKLRRRAIVSKHSKLIDSMFS